MGAVGVLVSLFMHSVSSLVFVAMWWALDMMTRYLVQASCRYRISGAKLRRIGVHGEERGSNEPAIKILFPKPEGLDYNPGQFVELVVPQMSRSACHPICLSSAAHEPVVTMRIRAIDDWSSKLVALDKQDQAIALTAILMAGQTGALQVDLDDEERYKVAIRVLLSGSEGFSRNSICSRDMLSLSIVSTQTDGSAARHQQLSGVFVYDIYCTKEMLDEEKEKLSNQYNFYSGRPNLDTIFGEVKEMALATGEHNIVVFWVRSQIAHARLARSLWPAQ